MWTKEEINKLTELYPDNYNKDIAILLNKTKKAIDNKGNYLKLKKNNELIDKRNKLGHTIRIEKGGRNLTYDLVKTIASKYKTKIDFKHNDDPAYQTALKKGWLKDICSHMTVLKFSIPQLILRDILDNLLNLESKYNDRTTLKPYEIDIYYPEFKCGFEYQGIAWHKNNKNDNLKLLLANDKNIKIIFIDEYENSRNYEKDIKKQLIGNLNVLNDIFKLKLTIDDILNYKVNNIYLTLYNKEELLNIAKKYSSFIDFKNKEHKVYRKLLKMGLIDFATSHMLDKKNNKVKISNDEIINIINKYDNLTDFRKEELKLYKHIKRVKKDFLIINLKRK